MSRGRGETKATQRLIFDVLDVRRLQFDEFLIQDTLDRSSLSAEASSQNGPFRSRSVAWCGRFRSSVIDPRGAAMNHKSPMLFSGYRLR